MTLPLQGKVWKIDSRRLGGLDKYILLAMAEGTFPGSDQCQWNQRYLAKVTGLSRRQIIRVFGRLKEMGLIETGGRNNQWWSKICTKVVESMAYRAETDEGAGGDSVVAGGDSVVSGGDSQSPISLSLPLYNPKDKGAPFLGDSKSSSKAKTESNSTPSFPEGKIEKPEVAAVAKSKLKAGEYSLGDVNKLAAAMSKPSKAKVGTDQQKLKIGYRDMMRNIMQIETGALKGIDHGQLNNWLKCCEGDVTKALHQIEMILSNWAGFQVAVELDCGAKIYKPSIAVILKYSQSAINFTATTMAEKDAVLDESKKLNDAREAEFERQRQKIKEMEGMTPAQIVAALGFTADG